MVTVTGKASVKRYFDRLPKGINGLLRGAANAGGKVIAEEARKQVTSDQVRAAIITRAQNQADRIGVWVTVKGGWPYSLATWLEYGTDPHDIKFAKARSLKIGDRYVGAVVQHPGARPYPFFRPALDLKGSDAIAAAQKYIDGRVSRAGISAATEPREDAA